MNPHGLDRQHDEGAGGILGKGLIDADHDLGAGVHLTFEQVRFNQLVSGCTMHGVDSTRAAIRSFGPRHSTDPLDPRLPMPEVILFYEDCDDRRADWICGRKKLKPRDDYV
jgi:hypothetical protein